MLKLSSPATREFWEVPVLFEDEHLLALNKPPLLLTSPDRFGSQRTSLLGILHRDIERGAAWVQARGLTYLRNAHRLDADVSGIVLLAKSRAVLIALANLFGSEKMDLVEIALVQGSPSEQAIGIEAKLATVSQSRSLPLSEGSGSEPTGPSPRMRVDERKGKRSRTEARVRERFAGYTLLECRPLTHRVHQVRAHLRHVGLPVVGDALYGGSPLLLSRLKSEYRLKRNKIERPLLSRPALHAERVHFVHPITGAQLSITAPCAKDMGVALRYLGRYKSSPCL